MKLLDRSVVVVMLLVMVWPTLVEAQRNVAVTRVDATSSDKRVALVIGNSAYKDSPLRNPVNDARDVAAKLRGFGFDVVERTNVTIRQIGSTLREFRSKLVPGSVALVFYAGHGLQIKGDNYLPAVDADISGEEDVHNQSLAMRQIMDVLDDAKTRLTLVFLDACRTNPYARNFRSGAEGLAKVSAPSGTLISFATRPGSVAADGNSRNGLYTSKLLEQMGNSGQSIEQLLKRVVTEVKIASKGRQEPWMEGSIEGDFCFGTCVMVSASSSALSNPMPSDAVAIELSFWDSIKSSTDLDNFKAYLDEYPNGRFAALARIRLKPVLSAIPPVAPVQIAAAAPSAQKIAPPAIGVTTAPVPTGLSTPKLVRSYLGHADAVYSTQFSPDTRSLVSGSFDSTARVWNVQSGSELQRKEKTEGVLLARKVLAVAVSPDNKLAAAVGDGPDVIVWDLTTGLELNGFTSQDRFWKTTFAVSFSPNGKVIASGDEWGGISFWNVEARQFITRIIGHGGWVTSLAYTPDNQRLITASQDRTIAVWNVNEGRKIRSIRLGDDWARTVAITSDGKRVLSGGTGNALKLWDIETGNLVRTFTEHEDEVFSVSISRSGKYAVSGSRDLSMKIWDMETGKVMHSLQSHKDTVFSVAFSLDDKFIVSAGADKSILLWDIAGADDMANGTNDRIAQPTVGK